MPTLTAPPAEPPTRSPDQRMDALKRANEIRFARAQLKRDLKARRRNVLDILLEPPDWAATMKIFDLLLAVPKFGRVKVDKHLKDCRISVAKTIGGLTDRQRADLASRFAVSLDPFRPLRPGIPVTGRQAEVLRAACTLGNAGVAHADNIARSMSTTVSAISYARHRLQAVGLLDEFGQPTDRGRALGLELAA